MEMMKRMIVGLVLVAALALPAFAAPATLQKDVVSLTAVRSALEKVSPNSADIELLLKNEQLLTAFTGKTIISNSVVEEALLKFTANGRSCGETCIFTSCFVTSCKCDDGGCIL